VKLRNCIIDKGVQVPNGETIGLDSGKDRARFTISDNGIVVVPKNYRFS
jgi:glucose-1-phosphate adenylyltransferase